MRERLLVFVLELADYSVTFGSSGWRPGAVGLILLLFEAVMDPSNITPDNLVVLRALMPTQIGAISSCFEEYLEINSDDQRLVLMGRLLRLRVALPAWPSREP